MNKQKILITGSCGFIFSNFVRKVVYENLPHSICSIDRISNNSLNNIYWNKSHEFHIGDITDSHFLNLIFEFTKPDIVIHGAAETSVDKSLKDPRLFIHSNVLGTQSVIDACVKWKTKKIIYMSADQVYGQLASENDLEWNEDNKLEPCNPYSASKAAGELLIKSAYNSFGLNYNIIRASNNYGPRQSSEKLIPKVIKSILNNSSIELYDKGLQIRDWTHVHDTCSAINQILLNGIDNNIYNVSSKQEFSNLEVVQYICNSMGMGHQLIKFIESPRASHDFRYAMDNSKIKSLGWKPQYKFKDGISGVVDWYKLNKYFL